MSTMSEEARAAAKSKVDRLMKSDPNQRVDASGYKPDGAMEAGAPTGMRPVSRRAFKRGGKVAGESSPSRADRKPRASGGALTANSLVNRNVKSANDEREGIKHVGGFNKGGAAHGKGCDCGKCDGGRVGRKSGGPAINDGTRPVAGRLARKGGGRTKKGTNVNIIIAPQGGSKPPMMPMGGAPPPGGPVGLHQGAPPPPPVAAGAPPPAGPAPMMRKSGGRTLEKDGGKLVKPGKYPIESGAGGGLGRLEKAARA